MPTKKGTKTAAKGTARGKAKPAGRTAPAKKAKAVPKKAAPTSRPVKETPRREADPKLVAAVAASPKVFSSEELKYFKELILAKRKETIEELDSLKESMMDVTTGEYISESSNYSLHMEQGTDAMEREKTFLYASRGSKYVNQLDDALARIDTKSFGVCKVCGLLVPKERLEAVPVATTCAEYKNTGMPCERGRIALARKKTGK
jgi:DnaK suppressor protein